MRRLRRGSTLNRPQVARAALVVGAAAALCVAGASLGRGQDVTTPPEPGAAITDPLSAEFERCNRLGYAALDDDGCAAAWAEHRRRFFMDRSRRDAPPLPEPEAS